MDVDCGQQLIWHCDTTSGQCEQRCNNDQICPNETICENFVCVPSQCDTNADCKMGMNPQCVGGAMGHGRCMNVVMCDAMGNCPPNMVCDKTTNNCQMLPACVSDRDCMNNSYCENNYCQPSTACSMAMPCPATRDCVGGTCVPAVCRGDTDCTMGQRCIGGMCQNPPSSMTVTMVRIITPAGVVRPTTTYRFTAVALDQSGAVVPDVTFIWMSSSTGVATIDGTGLATGGQTAGVTMVTASAMAATGLVTSAPVMLRNLGPVPGTTGVRVSVVDLSNGSPIEHASVQLVSGVAPVTMMTDASGSVSFPAPAPASFGITAAEPNHDFVTILGLTTNDVLVGLPPLTKPTLAGGIQGAVDFTNVTTMGALSVSLSGASFASPLVGFDPAQLFGGDIFILNIQNPQGGGNLMIPVPASATLSFAFGPTNIPLKGTYYARATSGERAAWGLAGKLDVSALMMGGGGAMGGNFFGTLLPYLQRWQHGVKPVVDVVAIAEVPDTHDINGNGNTTELVPDYAHFPMAPLAPDTSQTLRYELKVAALPAVSGGNANALLVVGGTMIPGVGFVPLGLDGQQDTGMGIVGDFTTKIAPAHGGLEAGAYAILATAIRLNAGALPGPGSVRLLTAPRLPETVDLSDGWVGVPTMVGGNSMSRTYQWSAPTSATYYRLAFANADGAWNVYSPTPMVTVPAAPQGLMDRTLSATVSIDAIRLAPNTTSNALFDVSAGGAQALDNATQGFARVIVGH
jgi:hypothetical protein